MLNLLDIIIIIIILITGVLGFKRGVFKELIMFVGMIIVFIVSYKLKNYIGDFLVLNFPFINFANFLNGATALNIVVYQSLAFIIMIIILQVIYNFIVSLTGVFEKILRFTIILGLPSKILGFLVGMVEGYVIAYIVVFFITQPALNLDFAKESKYADTILYKTPFLTELMDDTLDLTKEIYALKDIENANELNLKIIDIVLKREVTSVEVIEKLVDKGKLNVKNVDEVINKYKEDYD